MFSPRSAQALIRLGSSLFSVGVRMALPVVALLVMVDVALALLGRLNAQLQLFSLAFPAKMLAALVVLSWMAALFPRILLEFGRASSGGRAADAGDMTGHGGPIRQNRTTHPAAPEKAREEGQFPSAREFVSALQFMVFLGCWEPAGRTGSRSSAQTMRAVFARAFTGELAGEDVSRIAWQLFWRHFLPLWRAAWWWRWRRWPSALSPRVSGSV